MVYHQKLVACIKVNGQVLRETGDSVSIPFGSEYSILLKNLNSVRVQCKVSVDGKDATEGTWLVIQPNSSIELERFIRNGNLSNGNRLKFIERTGKIEQHRGIQAEDGLIRIEYKTEKVELNVPVIHYYPHYVPVPHWPRPSWPWWWGGSYIWDDVTYVYNSTVTTPVGSIGTSQASCDLGNVQASYTANAGTANAGSANNVSHSPLRSRTKSRVGIHAMGTLHKSAALEANDAGITVPGSESSQQFYQAAPFQVYDNSEVLVIRLRGEVGGKKVVRAVTVKTKPTCSTCGKVNKPTSRFCAECGTALSLL